MFVSRCLLFWLLLKLITCLNMSPMKPDETPDMQSLIRQMTLMEQRLKTLEAQAQITNSELRTVKGLLKNTENELSAIRAKQILWQSSAEKSVAFQVTQIRDLYTGGFNHASTSLKLNTVDYNTGSGYNNMTGIFTAPAPGTYLFWASVFVFNDYSECNIKLYRDKQVIGNGITKMQNVTHPYKTRVASITSVTHLEKGNNVYFNFDKPNKACWIDNSGTSSYGGELIHAD